jgi:transcriptional regulator with XRE-family HTH domain
VLSTLDKQLAAFLRRKRGEQTYAAFSKKIGVAPSTLHRLEQGQQSITLRVLNQVLDRLDCTLQDVFPLKAR